MSKVLVTHSYFYKLDRKQWKTRQPYPPLGTLQAAAVLRESGHDVSFFDTGLRDKPEEIGEALEKEKPTYVVIYDDGFNYLTKMCLTVMREAAFKMAEISRRLGHVVIVNSSDASDNYEKYFLHGVDYVIRGEGEESLKDLISCLNHKQNPSSVSGVAYKSDTTTVLTPARPVMRDLDALPLPAWDMIDLVPYREIWKKYHGFFSLNMATTRGCPYKCNWCAKPIYGNRYNSRSPEHVVRELELLQSAHHADHIWMCDDIFGLKPGWVKRFNEVIAEKKLTVRYKIQSRVDLLLEEETVENLSNSGCETVWVGAESGSQKILDAMDKGTTVAQIDEATKQLKKAGIKVGYFLQFGYPGELQKDIDETLGMVLRGMPDEIGISVSYPLPGTKFYEKVKSQFGEKQNWTDSDDLALMFHNTYAPSFYKALHRYVHSRYRIQRGWQRIRDIVRKPYFLLGDFRKLMSMIYHIPLSQIYAFRLRRLGTPLPTTHS